ncbi:MAG: hypothetical protein EAY81_02455 [Bacteroidetes bacterium]|nr:MAG: hypothetical protein EAY81_02455 [Bacteroidota bacterium]
MVFLKSFYIFDYQTYYIMHQLLLSTYFDGEQGMMIFAAILLILCVPFTIGYLVWRSKNRGKE